MNGKRAALAILTSVVALGAARPAAACAPVTVFFDWNSAQVEEEARAALQRLALALAWKGPDLDFVTITAHTDSSGSPRANRALALRRAEAVRDVLASFGAPPQHVVLRLAGANRLRVWTPGNVRERYNRRVEVTVQLSAEGQARQLEREEPIC